MTHENTPLQSGVIIVTDPDQDSRALNIPVITKGGTFTLDLTSGDTRLGTPRKIQMDDIPSASLITLYSRNMKAGEPEWSLRLKTTHHTARLNNQDVDYFFNTYIANDFIKEGLGIVVEGKSTGTVKRDTLGKVVVVTSPTPPHPLS
ncbi:MULTISPECIES: hypothetical protein [Pseudomonas]|uniref:hypothetical protein n=1 Tax=Pseudomonas TaxID=286 RepID=UPI001EDB7DF7|nr:hypothetical protein [Pseudomonas sp. PGPR81]